MELLDTTLREGEQCYGVFFPIETKKRIALLLDAIGVDFIEIGHPAAAPSIRKAVSEIAALDLRPRLIGHARLDHDEIRLVRDLGLKWVGLFSGINEATLARYGLTREAAYARIVDSLRYAKDLGLNVRFTCEDASRSDPGELIELYSRMRELGADRLSYADTVGTDTPDRIVQLHRAIHGAIPFSSLHFHFHNDQGRALENAMQVQKLGAQCIDGSIMGIGERAGLLSIEDAVLRLRPRGPRRAAGDRELLEQARELVSVSINMRHFARRRFAHKSGIHIHGVLCDPAHYEAVDPGRTGEQRIIVLSKLIGRAGLRRMLSWGGIDVADNILEQLLDRVKSDEFLELTDSREINRYLEGNYRQVLSAEQSNSTRAKHAVSACL
ncbi:MAG: homocitrate synthase/isopropylmalate synthase family protein [Nitrospirota bacterium]